MKKYINFIVLCAFVIFGIYFFTKQCSSIDDQPKMTKEIVNATDNKAPEQTEIPDSIVYRNVYIKSPDKKQGAKLNDKDSLIQVIALQNIELEKAYNRADSIGKKVMFQKLLKPKRFKKILDDENITITDSGIVVGDIKSQKISYIWKPKPILPNKRHYFLGAGIGSDVEFKYPTGKAKITMQDKKGNLQGISIDNRKTVMFEYDVKIW